MRRVVLWLAVIALFATASAQDCSPTSESLCHAIAGCGWVRDSQLCRRCADVPIAACRRGEAVNCKVESSGYYCVPNCPQGNPKRTPCLIVPGCGFGNGYAASCKECAEQKATEKDCTNTDGCVVVGAGDAATCKACNKAETTTECGSMPGCYVSGKAGSETCNACNALIDQSSCEGLTRYRCKWVGDKCRDSNAVDPSSGNAAPRAGSIVALAAAAVTAAFVTH